jgi:RNA polymerase sigma-70 factor (ECF subfamily)
VHEKYPELERAEDLVPLSLEIARLKIVATRRKIVRRGEHNQVPVDDLPLAGNGVSPFDEAAYRERVDRLETALKSMGERCRELFRLKLQGHSFGEIQKLLKVESISTLYTWDFRCRKELREKLGPEWETTWEKKQ